MEDRRDSRALIQEEKYKRLPSLPMYKRLRAQKSRPGLKRESFIVNVETLGKSMDVSTDAGPEQVTVANPWPAWRARHHMQVLGTVNGVESRSAMDPSSVGTEAGGAIEKCCPKREWVGLCADGSAADAIGSGGGGVFAEWLDGSAASDAFPTGAACSDCRAEAEALVVALNLVKSTPGYGTMKFVLLSDARSVLQALDNQGHRSFPRVNQLLAEVASVSAGLVLRWIPGHCCIEGSEQADSLAGEGSAVGRIWMDMSLGESGAQIGTAVCRRWIESRPGCSKTDAYCRLGREGRTIIFRLRSVHDRLKKHMHAGFKIGTGPKCPCGSIAQTAEHILQDCPLHAELRQQTWPKPSALDDRLNGTGCGLTQTVEFIKATGLQV